jgi:hypothetical protein
VGVARRWGWIFVVALVARLAYWAFVTPRWTPRADADQYVEIARNLADGHGFALQFPEFAVHATAFRPPLYPFLITPLVWVFGEALWPLRLLNAGIGSLVAVLAAVLAARIAGHRAGAVAGVVVAMYPPLLANDTVTLTEPLALALLLVAVLAALDRQWVGAGVAIGLTLLTRPNGYLLVAVFAAWFWWQLGWRRAAAFCGVALVLLVPWLIRNEVQVGTFRATTSEGFTLAAMYSPQAQQAGTFLDPAFSTAYDDPEIRLSQFDEAEWNRTLTDLAFDGLRDDPGYVLHVVGRNATGFFELDPSINRLAERDDGRHHRFRTWTLPLFYAVTVVGLIGLWWYRRSPAVWLLAACVGQFVVVSLVIVAPPRLRAPFDLVCCIGVGLFAARVSARQPSSELPSVQTATT